MGKRLLFFALMCCSLFAWAQSGTPACDFHIRVDVTQATCYNNGRIQVTAVDSDGNPLYIAPTTEDENPYNHLSTIKFAHRNLHSGVDTMEQWTTESMMTVDTGTYVVGAQVICFDPSQSGDDRYTILETYDTVTVTTTYVKPKVELINQDAQTALGYGTVPTLICDSSGRVQLKIFDGRFPYMIRLADENLVPYDTLSFPTNQYTGTNRNRYDFNEYYSIEGLPVGKYYFFVEDGCDYHLPMVWQSVGEVHPPRITAINWYEWSGSYADSNVIRTQITVNMPNAYYNKPEYVQYRFIHENINGVTDTTEWKTVPGFENLSTGNNYVTVKDTIRNAHGYCDIYNKKITFQARMTACGDTINLTRSHI